MDSIYSNLYWYYSGIANLVTYDVILHYNLAATLTLQPGT